MTSSLFIEPEVVLGTTTSWLPVTTAYPSVAGCASAFFWFPGQPGPAAWDPGYGYFAGGSLRCLPPQATSWWELPHQNPDGHTSLSIQPIVCPAAFTTAATEIRSVSSTLVKCCPSGYDLQGGQPGSIIGECVSPLTSGQVLTYTAQASNYSWISSTLSIRSASSVSAVAMQGWNVARAATATISSTSSTTTSPTSTPTNASHSPAGLSTGAKAGIGVAIAAVVVGFLIMLGLFIRRQRRRKHQSDTMVDNMRRSPPIHEMPYAKGFINQTRETGPTYEMSHAKEPMYRPMGAGPVYEMPPSQNLTHEMYQHPAELESSTQGKKSNSKRRT